jgi:signal transduction histidine kinase
LATASIQPLPPDPLRLRRRLGLQGVGFGLLLLTAFAAAVYWGIAAERRQNLRVEVSQLAAAAAAQLPLISHEIQEEGNARKFRNDREVVPLGERRSQRVQWFDAAGRLLLQEGQLPLPAAAAIAPGAGPRQWQQWTDGLSLHQPVYTRRRDAQTAPPRLTGYVRVALAMAPLEQELGRLRRGLLLGGITAVIVALMVGRRLLVQAFLPLQRQVEALERFTADASHELRHPLTLLRTLLASQPAPSAALLHRLDAIAVSMTGLLNDLLFLARQEQRLSAGPVSGDGWRRFDLLELLEDRLLVCAALPAAAALRLNLEPPSGESQLQVHGQPEQLQRLFTNLLLNAIRFSPPGGVVVVSVRRQLGRLRIQVSDQGPGIALHHRQAVFERFWTLDPAGESDATASSTAAHSGLGLPIARAIARRHGGELSLVSGEPGACMFLVELPAA